MQQGMFLFSVILCAQTVLAQTVAVKFASDAGVFVGAATACGMMNLVARYTLRVDMVLTDIATDEADKERAKQAFAETQSEALAFQLRTPVSSCDDVRDMVRHRRLLRGFNRIAQQRLKGLGFDPGLVDGIWGPLSRVALRRYQETQGLPATGEVDRATLTSLEIELVY